MRQVLRVSGAGSDEVNGDYKLHPDGDYKGKPQYLHSSGNGFESTLPPSIMPFFPTLPHPCPAWHPPRSHPHPPDTISGAAAA